MAELLVPDIEEETVRRLRERAARNQRSLEDEARCILGSAASEPLPAAPGANPHAAFIAWVNATAAKRTGPVVSDSADIIRNDRDTDHGRDPLPE